MEGIKKGHLAWRDKIDDLFEGRRAMTAADLTDHQQCPFGKWYYSAEAQKAKQLPAFQKAGNHHRAFHELVSEIVRLWNQKQTNEAMARFQKLLPHTNELFALLDQLTVESMERHD